MGANAGWINLGTNQLRTDAMFGVDSDGDAISDAWELEQFGTLITAGIGTDQDGDGRAMPPNTSPAPTRRTLPAI